MPTSRTLAAIAAAAVGAVLATAAPAAAHTSATSPAAVGKQAVDGKQAVAVGYGGAVSSVDLDAPKADIEVLRHGEHAADAAVAAAATLAVMEHFQSGLGGGGYFVYYDAKTVRDSSTDGRETGPAAFNQNIFVDPATSQPYAFATA